MSAAESSTVDAPLAGAQRIALVVTTAISVVSDATILPFYPKMFRESFGVADPKHVGLYLAAMCLTVMVVLPGWAALERRIGTLKLLMLGQGGSAVLGVATAYAPTVTSFWVLSLAMIVCKASYWLMYPYVLRLTSDSARAGTIAVMTVLVHVGGIAGATAGGALLDVVPAQALYLLMSAGDTAQLLACAGLLLAGAGPPADEPEATPEETAATRHALIRLGWVMLLYYGSVWLVRPFFADYWAMRSGWTSTLVAGLVFAIPAWASLATLAAERRGMTWPTRFSTLAGAALAGVLLQALPWVAAILVGRVLMGWAVFVAMVRLDIQLFETSTPEAFSRDFARMNIAQQLGVLVSFYAAGSLVAAGGLVLPFLAAAVGIAASAWFYQVFFVASAEPSVPATEAS